MGYKHGKKWTDDLIKQEMLRVKEGLELNRMPTRSECVDFSGSHGLSVAVTRRQGGWYQLAKDLGLPIKESETTLGKSYEIKIARVLEGAGHSVKRMSQNFPYDLLVDDFVKVDIKASHLYRGSAGNFYTFRMGKAYATCDIYILVTLDDKNEILGTYVVPSSSVMNNKQISIGEINSIYHQYKDRWDFIDEYKNFQRRFSYGTKTLSKRGS